MKNYEKMLGELDCYLILDPYHLTYYTGFTGGEGMAIIHRDFNILYTDSRYTEAASKEAKDFIIRDIANYGSYKEAFAKDIRELNCKTVGFEDETILYKDYTAFEDALHAIGIKDAVTFVPATKWMNSHRMIKSDDEIACIRQAEAIGDMAFKEVLPMIKAGVTEAEIALFLETSMKRHGASNLSFDTIVASGENSSMPHAGVTNRVIKDGDLITMDFGCIYKGYCSDMTRTVAVGNISDQLKEIYEVVLKAQLAALDQIGPGKVCSDIDKVARDIIKDTGYGKYFGHGLGHSVGLFIHEEPRLSPRCDEVLKPGMTMTVEPGIYLPGVGGVRIEDLVVITEDGYENLAHSPKEMMILG